jgi:isoamylase
VKRFADRLVGSPEIYGYKGRQAEDSVNFVTCHDGFTINDLVSYNAKHNEANGEQNRDGADDNRSWNCGVEGPTDDPEIEKLRNRQVKNLLSCTMLSLGMPMLCMGDEVRRTQLGNNNAYCQDNVTSWLDWTLQSKHPDVYRFLKLLIQRRLLRDVQSEYRRESLNQILKESIKAWHGVKLFQPDWSNWSRSVALSFEVKNENQMVHFMLNAYWEPLEFELPPLSEGGGVWRRWIDTTLDSPEDIVEWQAAPQYTSPTYRAGPRSVAVLYAPSVM